MWTALAWVVGFVVSYLLYKPPQQQKPKKPTASDVDAPVAEVGKNIPVVFGTVLVKDVSVAWWGDFKTKAIRTKGKKG